MDVSAHRGIVSYRPEEMVLTARAGTPISSLVAATAEYGQCLPFEPAEFAGRATIGGTLAAGLSGPARPWRGSVRDAVLGVRLINGKGESLRFGGEVMKNVAGYDVSRLQAGALGTLGLITEVSLRLSPVSQETLYLSRPCADSEALTRMRELARRPLPLSGACWYADTLQLRFAGTGAAIDAIRRELDGFEETQETLWEAIREWSLAGLSPERAFWGLDLAPATPLYPDLPVQLIDWAGARRFGTAAIAESRASSLRAAGGHVTSYGAGSHSSSGESPALTSRQIDLQRRIKRALDPRGVFNPGRLYHWL